MTAFCNASASVDSAERITRSSASENGIIGLPTIGCSLNTSSIRRTISRFMAAYLQLAGERRGQCHRSLHSCLFAFHAAGYCALRVSGHGLLLLSYLEVCSSSMKIVDAQQPLLLRLDPSQWLLHLHV